MSRKLITFAGVSGCGKTPVATYLSWKLGWGMFGNDPIRNEIQETKLESELDQEGYMSLRNARLDELMALPHNIILDVSVDREWQAVRARLAKHDIKHFLISYNLSESFVRSLYEAKGYDWQFAPRWLGDHAKFLQEYSGDIDFVVSDETYADRIGLVHEAARAWTHELPES